MKNKKVLVTGSSGFIGSHIADILYESGYNIILFDSIPSLYKNKNQVEFIGDILNVDDVNQAMEGCSYVFHFAAQADIELSNKNPVDTIKINILGTQNILESARKNKIKRIFFASTIYVYSELGSFYRVSKQSCEKIIEEYEKEYNIKYTILRFGSLYGPRANKFNAINKFLFQALKYNKITRNGNGEEIREYIHVKDACKLCLDAMNDKYVNKHLIITGSQSIKVRDLLIMISEMFQNKIKIEYIKANTLHHYQVTPYNFRPAIAEKIQPKENYDLGQGILDLIYSLSQNEKSNNK
tara:strand:- start:600 stop:1490 length:891 start_codon:yes stop_codon:yes gene_type:complete